MVAACARFGDPQESFPAIHVAGTNGKGSVCTKIARAFELAGYKVGLFTSPHITCCTERMQICGQNISQRELCDILDLVYDEARVLSFFEITTLVGLLWFKKRHADVVVLEAGLGGRLDATNICHPQVCAITSISLDHTACLGETREAIAVEKAGIIKAEIPIVIGPNVPRGVIEERARFKNAPCVRVRGSWCDFDVENSAIARATLSVLATRWPKILDRQEEALGVRPLCRFQRVPQELVSQFQGASIPVIMDVAHNPDGISHLIAKAKDHRFVFLFAVSCDKEIHAMVKIMAPVACGFVCTQADCPRVMSAEALAAIVTGLGREATAVSDPTKAVSVAIAMAQKANAGLLITGTFYLMSVVKRALGYKEQEDSNLLIGM